MERDSENTHYSDHARHYEALLDRFLSPDKLEGNPEDPQGWNRYAYAYNNPLRHVDSDGQDAWDVLAGFANAVGSNFTGGGRQPAPNSDAQIGQTLGDVISIPLGGLEILAGGATFTGGVAADATVVGAPLGVALNAAGAAAVGQGALGAASGAVHLIEAASQGGLGNPFKGKTPDQADKMMRDKGYETRGPDPKSGKGGYVNPETGRSYHIDPGAKYRKGVEVPHVDVNRPKGSDLPKKKLPLKEPK
jgi:RHS repeat-associated protein